MAGVYKPTIFNYPAGQVTVASTTATPYADIINSLGSFVYMIRSVHIQTTTAEQLLKPIYFREYNVDGTIKAFSQMNGIDPYQNQNALDFEIIDDNTVLNGRAGITMQVSPNEVIFLLLRVSQLSNGDYLKRLDFFSDSIFQGYADQI